MCVLIMIIIYSDYTLIATDHAHISSPSFFSHFDSITQTVREHYWNIIIEGNY